MEIRKINVDTAAIGGAKTNFKKDAKEEKEAAKVGAQAQSEVKAEKMIDAMSLMGLYNQLSVHRGDDFLAKLGLSPDDSFDEAVDKLLASGKVSPKNVEDIDKAVNGEFATGVQSFANSLEEEFPQVFDEASRNALAARMYAQE